MSFQKNVFINCPFDDDYLPLLRPLLFTVLELGYSPKLALANLDSGEPRINKILSLVAGSRFGIHDLSRLKAEKAGEFFRLNMPFELGLDVGCRRFKGGKWAQKRCLILEAERYRFQAAISDLSNSDIAVHKNNPIEIVSAVRNWLNNEEDLRAPGAASIWGRFGEFMAKNYDALKFRGYSSQDIERQDVGELIADMRVWLRKSKRS